MKKVLVWTIGAVAVLAVLMQLVPLDRTNPPVTREVRWDSPQTRALARRACLDCHSNETVWPWYSRLAPVSFLLVDHIEEGRENLNFSEWDKPNSDFGDVEDVILSGEMPLASYLPMHPEARLSATEKEQLVAGLEATFAADPPVRGRGNQDGDDDD